jgi:hypothetical protein
MRRSKCSAAGGGVSTAGVKARSKASVASTKAIPTTSDEHVSTATGKDGSRQMGLPEELALAILAGRRIPRCTNVCGGISRMWKSEPWNTKRMCRACFHRERGRDTHSGGSKPCDECAE